MDEIDRRILDILQRDGKVSQARIAESVGLTTPSVNERIKKLETRGFIRRFTALLDPRLVGMPIVAHVDVVLEHPRFERPFLDEIENLLDVQECYAISGEYGYRLKLRARDVEHLESLLREKVQSIRGVARTRVELSLSIKKDSTLLALG
jgi:Lrp/AsnC family leucine-responsive transcriptional regulator